MSTSKDKEKKIAKEKKQSTKPKSSKTKKKISTAWNRKKPMSNDELKRFLSGIIRGEISDFAGLDAGLDVRIKAAKELREINDKEESVNAMPEFKVSIAIQDTTSEEMKSLDKDLKDEYED